MRVLLFNVAMLAVDVGALVLLRRRPSLPSLLSTLTGAAAACVFLALAAYALQGWMSLFGVIDHLAWGFFLHGFVLLVGGGFILRKHALVLSKSCFFAAGLLAALALYAFRIEPQRLELTHHEITTDRVDRRIRIAVVADLQTDSIGTYERRALERVMAEDPDLILLPGDYIHELDPDRARVLEDDLNALFHEVGLAAPLGVYAVRGNVEADGWERIFSGLEAKPFDSTTTVDGGELIVTCLSFMDSFDTELVVGRRDGFQIVLGHAPDFALGTIDADLLVAGHTHGGQVRIPFFGPPVTLSKVPRSWASGRTKLEGGRTLIVSRGVGMERGPAPRLRFLCRPELVVIDLVPLGSR